MQIEANTVVSLVYHLHANLQGKEKQHIESTDVASPFTFLFGAGGLIPGFEKNLFGKSPGDKFDFTIAPGDAYGDVDTKAILQLPVSIFKVDNVVDFGALKVGNILPMSDDEGSQMNGKVVAFNDETVTMDFNHPLAGQTLHFSGEVVDVRAASEEEVAHRHVHSNGHAH